MNVAARLEGINKLFGTTICISDSIYDQVRAEILARPLKRVQVKGRKTEFMIYELLALARQRRSGAKGPRSGRATVRDDLAGLATVRGRRSCGGGARLSRHTGQSFPTIRWPGSCWSKRGKAQGRSIGIGGSRRHQLSVRRSLTGFSSSKMAAPFGVAACFAVAVQSSRRVRGSSKVRSGSHLGSPDAQSGGRLCPE